MSTDQWAGFIVVGAFLGVCGLGLHSCNVYQKYDHEVTMKKLERGCAETRCSCELKRYDEDPQ